MLGPESDGAATLVTAPGEGSSAIAARSPLQLFWRRLRRDRVAMTSLGFIALLVAVAALAPVITGLAGTPDPRAQSSEALDLFGTPTGPSAQHRSASTDWDATSSREPSTARAFRSKLPSSPPASRC